MLFNAIVFFSLLLMRIHAKGENAIMASNSTDVLPIVLYHGLNATCCEGTMGEFIQQIRSALPLVYIHSIKIGSTIELDRLQSIFGNAVDQIDRVCLQLKADPKLVNGFNGIGLSQGGLLLRAYVQQCNDPPVRNLITLGSPHAGITDLPDCNIDAMQAITTVIQERAVSFIVEALPRKLVCHAWQKIVKSLVTSSFFQQLIMPAQYYIKENHNEKDTDSDSNDKDKNRKEKIPSFISQLNGRNDDTAKSKRLTSLKNFIMYRFEEEQIVVPALSAWFISAESDANDTFTFPSKGDEWNLLKRLPIYREDWIGLKELDQKGKLHFKSLPGKHLEIPNTFVKDQLLQYLNLTNSTDSTDFVNIKNR